MRTGSPARLNCKSDVKGTVRNGALVAEAFRLLLGRGVIRVVGLRRPRETDGGHLGGTASTGSLWRKVPETNRLWAPT